MIKFEEQLNEENFKRFIIEIEKENLTLINKAEKKEMVYRIEKCYEEAKKGDNK